MRFREISWASLNYVIPSMRVIHLAQSHRNWEIIMLIFSTAWWRHQMEKLPALLPFVRGIHRSPVNSPHKGQWRGALMFSLICVWINGSVNNRKAGDLRRYCAHYDVTVMVSVDGWIPADTVMYGLGSAIDIGQTIEDLTHYPSHMWQLFY